MSDSAIHGCLQACWPLSSKAVVLVLCNTLVLLQRLGLVYGLCSSLHDNSRTLCYSCSARHLCVLLACMLGAGKSVSDACVTLQQLLFDKTPR